MNKKDKDRLDALLTTYIDSGGVLDLIEATELDELMERAQMEAEHAVPLEPPTTLSETLTGSRERGA
jgi:hypothetical protein